MVVVGVGGGGHRVVVMAKGLVVVPTGLVVVAKGLVVVARDSGGGQGAVVVADSGVPPQASPSRPRRWASTW